MAGVKRQGSHLVLTISDPPKSSLMAQNEGHPEIS